jgi:hypothetical protein
MLPAWGCGTIVHSHNAVSKTKWTAGVRLIFPRLLLTFRISLILGWVDAHMQCFLPGVVGTSSILTTQLARQSGPQEFVSSSQILTFCPRDPQFLRLGNHPRLLLVTQPRPDIKRPQSGLLSEFPSSSDGWILHTVAISSFALQRMKHTSLDP